MSHSSGSGTNGNNSAQHPMSHAHVTTAAQMSHVTTAPPNMTSLQTMSQAPNPLQTMSQAQNPLQTMSQAQNLQNPQMYSHYMQAAMQQMTPGIVS